MAAEIHPECSEQVIAALARMRAERKLEFRIEVDGGVDLETVADVVKAGAELLVAGSAVFCRGDIPTNAKRLIGSGTNGKSDASVNPT